MHNSILLVSFVILLFLSMFFSASETSFASIALHKVDSLIKQKKNGAKALKKIKAEPDKVLMAILIGNNIVNIGAATLATTISITLAQLINYNEATIIGISTIIVTILVLLFGEIIPKTFAIRHAEKLGLSIAPFYVHFIKVLSPIIWVLTKITQKLNKGGEKAKISSEEIEAFIELSKNSGAFEETEYKHIKNMLNFGEITVEEAMTPRIKINAIPDTITVDQAITKLLELHHTRIPVYHKSIDDTEKVITLRELINFKNANNGTLTLRELALNPITKIPSPTPIDVALSAFKKSHKHIALVMDEYGGVAGLVTLEDVIEEIFGDIQDENDIETTPIRKIGKQTRNVQSFVRIDEFLTES
jgi:CBS domain containing-hemolysin-like protein